MIPGGRAAGGAVIADVARGFGSAMWHGMRGGGAAPVTVQIPAGALNSGSSAALALIAAQMGSEVAAFVTRITPYCTYGFYTFMTLMAIVILNKFYEGPIGQLLRAACHALLSVARSPTTKAAATKFFMLSIRVLKALFSLPATTYNAIISSVTTIQNHIGHRVRSAVAALAGARAYVRSTRNAVVGSLRRSLARVRTAGVRVATAVRGFRAGRAAGRKARNNAGRMAMHQKIRTNLAAVNRRVVAAEEQRITQLINKVKRTAHPLTSKEKREYLALARKAEKKATSANRNAAAALVHLRRSH